MRSKSALFVGNFLTIQKKYVSVSENLTLHLRRLEWSLLTTSSKQNKVAKLFDMVSTAVCRKHDYEVCHIDVYSGLAFFWAVVIGCMMKVLSKPYILTLHGGALPDFSKRWKCIIKYLISNASAVTVPSEYLLMSMKDIRPDFELIPNAINLNDYSFRAREHPQARLVWLRAFHAIYNPTLALECISLMTDKYPDIELVMIGPDKNDGSLKRTKELCAKLGIMDKVQFVGGVKKDEIPGLMAKDDIFISTTNIDNTPVSVIEAMASGLCIVSTNVGGIPYLLEHERDALLVPPNDPQAMADAVEQILKDPNLAARLSINARKKAETMDWSIVLPKWEALFNRVLEKETKAKISTHS